MPRKVRDLIRDLEAAGFVNRGGRGSHRNYVHPSVTKPKYQEKAVRDAIREAMK